MGLFIATPSYNNQITFSITTTRQIVPDTPFLISCFERALKELKEIAERRVEAADTPKTKRRRKSFHRTRSRAELASAAETPAPRKKAAAATKKRAPTTKRKTAAKPNGKAGAQRPKAAAAKTKAAPKATKATRKPAAKKAPTKKPAAKKPAAKKAAPKRPDKR